MLLRDNLQPTDFADAVVRVSDWHHADFYTATAVRVWICKCSAHWFQRHEWQAKGRNETTLDDWIYSGYYPHKRWPEHYKPAPQEDKL
jgi:hypothetical protein